MKRPFSFFPTIPPPWRRRACKSAWWWGKIMAKGCNVAVCGQVKTWFQNIQFRLPGWRCLGYPKFLEMSCKKSVQRFLVVYCSRENSMLTLLWQNKRFFLKTKKRAAWNERMVSHINYNLYIINQYTFISLWPVTATGLQFSITLLKLNV